MRNPNFMKDSEYLFDIDKDYRSNTVKILEDP